MANTSIVIGSGPQRVLALHGWFGSARGWGWLPDLVDPDRFTYAFVDYRGYGANKDVAGEYTLDEIAADALAVADELGWQRFALLGHSMGGIAAERVLADASDRVERLVGVSPVPANGIPFDEQSWALFSGAPDNPGNRRAIIDFTTGNRLSATWLDQMVRHSLENSTRDAFAAYLPQWGKSDISERVTGSDVPVLVVVGEHDPALSGQLMEQTWLRFHPQARLHVLGNAGHYSMFETPVALVTTVEAFLTG